MSEGGKPDLARGWLAVEKLPIDDEIDEEAERIEKLSGDELDAELRAEGRDPARIADGEELQRRVLARATREGKVGSPPPSSGLVAKAAGAVEEPPPSSRVIPIRRFSRLGWILAAAAVVLVVIAAVKRPQIIAAFHEPTPREVAESLRDDAVGSCEQGAWAACKDLLDQAARLDPAGETEERVQKARSDIAKATTPAPPRDDTPQP